MRKHIVAGNWKMNLTLPEGVELARSIREQLSSNLRDDIDVILAPSFLHVGELNSLISNTPLKLAVQNCAENEQGAYTGEVSAKMIASAGVQYVILGHSERRMYYHETSEILNNKLDLALTNGLKIIFCCGEPLDVREKNQEEEFVRKQLTETILKLESKLFDRITIAYEPIWAIGTGMTASEKQAQDMHKFIRGLIQENYNQEIANSTSILYGGSCNPNNAAILFDQPDIDGGLIGGASLKAKDFLDIVRSFK